MHPNGPTDRLREQGRVGSRIFVAVAAVAAGAFEVISGSSTVVAIRALLTFNVLEIATALPRRSLFVGMWLAAVHAALALPRAGESAFMQNRKMKFTPIAGAIQTGCAGPATLIRSLGPRCD